MSRALADILGAEESAFRLGLQRLERVSGAPQADIRLMIQVEQQVREKIQALGMDAAATTGPELFHALGERLKKDEIRVRNALGIGDDATSSDILAAVQSHLTKQAASSSVFAIKPTAMRTMLKKLKPKATMKALGYRSMESMFKHESIPQLLAATQIVESTEWQQTRLQAYGKLQAKDFELRKVNYTLPVTKRWPALARMYTDRHKHNMIVLPELGSIVFLPLEVSLPGLAIVTILLATQALNDIRSRSALLKLQQVRPDFGTIVQSAAQSEPMTDVEFGGQKLSWKLIHWFYGSQHAPYYPELFEPHLQEDDFRWYDPHAVLEKLDQNLEFWRGSYELALLDQHDAISLNILDVALGVCNGLDYGNRLVQNMREALGRELMARYLHHGNLQSMLEQSLGQQMTPELAFD